eukprot:scaffold111_cov121-Skeletonema_marinoi.AAC.1
MANYDGSLEVFDCHIYSVKYDMKGECSLVIVDRRIHSTAHALCIPIRTFYASTWKFPLSLSRQSLTVTALNAHVIEVRVVTRPCHFHHINIRARFLGLEGGSQLQVNGEDTLNTRHFLFERLSLYHTAAKK